MTSCEPRGWVAHLFRSIVLRFDCCCCWLVGTASDGGVRNDFTHVCRNAASHPPQQKQLATPLAEDRTSVEPGRLECKLRLFVGEHFFLLARIVGLIVASPTRAHTQTHRNTNVRHAAGYVCCHAAVCPSGGHVCITPITSTALHARWCGPRSTRFVVAV